MKATVMRPVEIDIAFVKIDVPVSYGTEDMPADFPFRKGNRWRVLVDIDTGKIDGWPQGVAFNLHMKVADGGIYKIDGSCKAGMILQEIRHDYVPHGVVPGKYGDYIELDIQADGTIANWPKKPDVSAFFKGGE